MNRSINPFRLMVFVIVGMIDCVYAADGEDDGFELLNPDDDELLDSRWQLPEQFNDDHFCKNPEDKIQKEAEVCVTPAVGIFDIEKQTPENTRVLAAMGVDTTQIQTEPVAAEIQIPEIDGGADHGVPQMLACSAIQEPAPEEVPPSPPPTPIKSFAPTTPASPT